MLYREAGQFKTSYVDDQAIFPIMQDRWFVLVVLLIAYLVVPFVSSEYFFEVVLIPFLVFSMAAIGLNLLLGYAGQLSLGTGAFMGLGAFMSYKLLTAFPDLNLIVAFLLAGLATGANLLWVLIKPSFDGLENVFMLPARNPPFLARRAAMFEGAVLAGIAPVAP